MSEDKERAMNNLPLDEIEAKIPGNLPVLMLRDVVAFPHLILPLLVARKKSVKAVEYALEKNKLVFLIAQRDLNIENPNVHELYSIGTVGIIMRTIRERDTDEEIKILVRGLCKARVLNIIQTEPFWLATWVKEEGDKSQCDISESEQLVLAVKEKLDQLIFDYCKEFPVEVMAVVENLTDPEQLAHLAAANIGLESFSAQEILEIGDPMKKLKRVGEILDEQIKSFKREKS